MSQFIPKSPSYQATMSGLLRLHQLSLDGQEESEAADLVRESMHEHWEGLSKVEKDRLTGLSKDLYEISDGPLRATEPINLESPQTKLFEAFEARTRGAWDESLSLLRECATQVSPAQIAYFRGRVWQNSGEPKTAALFFDHASRLDPTNEGYQALHLYNLKDADAADAQRLALAVLQVSESHPLPVVVYAADIVFDSKHRLADSESLTVAKQLISILERALARIEERQKSDRNSLAVMVFNLLATCYREVGETRKAYDLYSNAIQLDLQNDALLVARGMLVYGVDPNSTSDFVQALRLGSSLIWPYFYLAHHYLANNRFDECRLLCEQALHMNEQASRKPTTPRIVSELYGFLALSMTRLGAPEHDIRRTLENSIRVDPSNENARRNMEWFVSSLATHAASHTWERISESSMRRFGERAIRTDPVFSERGRLVPA